MCVTGPSTDYRPRSTIGSRDAPIGSISKPVEHRKPPMNHRKIIVLSSRSDGLRFLSGEGHATFHPDPAFAAAICPTCKHLREGHELPLITVTVRPPRNHVYE